MKDKPLAGTLNRWHKVSLGQGVSFVWGFLDRDSLERFKDGTYIHTSLTPDRPMKEGDVIETLNSRYTLGTEASVEDLPR